MDPLDFNHREKPPQFVDVVNARIDNALTLENSTREPRAYLGGSKHISITTGGIVIPANASVAFPIGATVVIYNDSATAQTIAITTDTLRQAGTASTGTRNLEGYGLATLVKVSATTWVISGAGVS